MVRAIVASNEIIINGNAHIIKSIKVNPALVPMKIPTGFPIIVPALPTLVASTQIMI